MNLRSAVRDKTNFGVYLGYRELNVRPYFSCIIFFVQYSHAVDFISQLSIQRSQRGVWGCKFH